MTARGGGELTTQLPPIRDVNIYTRLTGRAPGLMRGRVGGYLVQEGFALAGLVGLGLIDTFDVERVVSAEYDAKITMLTCKEGKQR